MNYVLKNTCIVLHSAARALLDDPGADPASKFRGGDFSNIWQSSLITGPLL